VIKLRRIESLTQTNKDNTRSLVLRHGERQNLILLLRLSIVHDIFLLLTLIYCTFQMHVVYYGKHAIPVKNSNGRQTGQYGLQSRGRQFPRAHKTLVKNKVMQTLPFLEEEAT